MLQVNYHPPDLTNHGSTGKKRLSKKKQRQWNRDRKSGKVSDQCKFKTLQKQQKKECRSAYNSYISDMVAPDLKAKPKNFGNLLRVKSTTHTIPSIANIEILKEGVLKLLFNQDPHKPAGPDEIPSILLKCYAKQLAPVLTTIYQASIDQSIIPNDWRKANVKHIFKKSVRANPENYRPISLTCLCCKVLEHIISSHVMDHFIKFNILSDAQHGFRPKRSGQSQLIITIHEIAQALDQGEQTDIILLDFQKAFDKRLLAELDHYGIRGNSNAWVCSFLSNRNQRVIIGGKKSDEVNVTSGVPQGSVL
eukprot:gene14691-16215_t